MVLALYTSSARHLSTTEKEVNMPYDCLDQQRTNVNNAYVNKQGAIIRKIKNDMVMVLALCTSFDRYLYTTQNEVNIPYVLEIHVCSVHSLNRRTNGHILLLHLPFVEQFPVNILINIRVSVRRPETLLTSFISVVLSIWYT